MIIAITGGIGAGKSVVSRALRSLGYPVYDCDERARQIQENDAEMRRTIGREVCAEALNADGTLNRPRLAACVFADAEKLQRLNRIVHGAVCRDLAEWAARHGGKQPLFVETALLHASGLDRMVNAEWRVVAPEELRIARVMARNGISRAQVEERIAAQEAEMDFAPTQIITNDGQTPIIKQINELTQRL